MLEQIVPSQCTWLAGNLEHPYGRGINLQIRVGDVHSLYTKFNEAESQIFLRLEEKWYRADNLMVGNLQFIVLDPDGYLLRFFQDLGSKNV